MELISTFAKRLKELMALRGMTRSALASLCGIDKSNITRYLKGDYKAKQDVVYQMAERLRVDPAWLMGYNVPMSDKMYLPDFEVKSSKELTEVDLRLLKWFRSLPPEKQRAILIAQDAPEDLI